MTCREKLKIERPAAICYDAERKSCPSQFGYLDDPEWCTLSDKVCERCWGREIPETNNQKTEDSSNHTDSHTIHSSISDILGVVAGGTGYIKIGLEKGKITNIYTELEKEF